MFNKVIQVFNKKVQVFGFIFLFTMLIVVRRYFFKQVHFFKFLEVNFFVTSKNKKVYLDTQKKREVIFDVGHTVYAELLMRFRVNIVFLPDPPKINIFSFFWCNKTIGNIRSSSYIQPFIKLKFSWKAYLPWFLNLKVKMLLGKV